MQNRLLDVPTTQNKVRFNDISILRVSAMLMVVFYHCLCRKRPKTDLVI